MKNFKTVKYKDYLPFKTALTTFYKQELHNLATESIAVDKFLDRLKWLQETAKELSCVCTSDFEKYSTVVMRNFPYLRIPYHERMHAEVAERYRLSVDYTLIAASDYGSGFFNSPKYLQIGMIINSLPVDGRGRSPDEILSYYKESANSVKNPSPIDRIIAKSVRLAKQRSAPDNPQNLIPILFHKLLRFSL